MGSRSEKRGRTFIENSSEWGGGEEEAGQNRWRKVSGGTKESTRIKEGCRRLW